MTNEEDKSIRILNDPVREKALNDLAKIIANFMLEIGMFTSCLNCGEWNNEKEICSKFKQRPPAKIIVIGCKHHQDIPF